MKFQDLTDASTLQVTTEEDDSSIIVIGFELETEFEHIFESVWFDIETAVKFSKELRKQIAIAKDFEFNSEDNE